MPDAREIAAEIFQFFLHNTGAKHIECQTNEPLLSTLQKQFSINFRADAFLFGNPLEKKLLAPEGCVFREIMPGDHPVFEHHYEPEGNFGIEKNGEIVATGGFLMHYNFPFADLFMEVRSDMRMRGIGSFLIQELIKTCLSAGRIPAARCNPGNLASQKTLLKGGFEQVGSILFSDINA